MHSRWGLSSESVLRAYEVVSPVYDLIFDRIFHPGRVSAIRLLEIQPDSRVLEVGIGTGLNLPLYPRYGSLTGVDLSQKMLRKAQGRVKDLAMEQVKLLVMDAMNLAFPDDTFDRVLATYVISVVPDPVQALTEIRRVCKPDGHIVLLNHFKSDHPVVGTLEEWVAPITTRLGLFTLDLKLIPLLEQSRLIPDQIHRANILNGWRLVRCINQKRSARSGRSITA